MGIVRFRCGPGGRFYRPDRVCRIRSAAAGPMGVDMGADIGVDMGVDVSTSDRELSSERKTEFSTGFT